MFEATGWILDETEIMDAIKYDLLPPTVVKSPADDQEVISINIAYIKTQMFFIRFKNINRT